MTVYGYEEWMARRRGTMAAVARAADGPRPVRRRPRTDEESRMLARATIDAVRRRRAEGRLVRIGERHYELRVG